MVLKDKYISLTILFFLSIFVANAQRELIYTDKYENNYFSNKELSNTNIYIASDLFQFSSLEDLYVYGAFIDSFLTKEKTNFNLNVTFENENTFKINLTTVDIKMCYALSMAWTERYKIEFQKLIQEKTLQINPDSVEWTNDKLIFKKLIDDEMSRFFNPSNSVNTVNIAFEVPLALAKNDFKKVFNHDNTKRYSSKESQLKATEIIVNNKLAEDGLKFSYPSLNRQTFLKNALSLLILQNIYKDDFIIKTRYFVNQAVTDVFLNNQEPALTDFKLSLEMPNLGAYQFRLEVQKAFKQIVQTSQNQLFYYTFYDIEKLKTIIQDFSINDLKLEVDNINNRDKFIVSINDSSEFCFYQMEVLPFKKLDFDKNIEFKLNSNEFDSGMDSLKLTTLFLFMNVNPNFKLNISSTSMPSEYIYIEKEKREELINQYEEVGYVISKKKNLALYRSLSIFSELTNKGIDYKRLRCIGLVEDSSYLNLNLFIQE